MSADEFPIPDDEMKELLRGFPADHGVTATAAKVVDAFERHMYVPDVGYLYAMLGAAVANLSDSDPVWLGLIDGPGGGKTEALMALTGSPEVRLVGTITPAALLSGTSKKERAAHAKGGLLKEIGEFGIIVAKDFGAILTMHREARAEALQALRDVYDGHYTRNVGSDGGQTLEWHGKAGFIFGATTTIDSHHVAMAALGERFLLYRLPQVERSEKFQAAFGQAGSEKQVRAELAALAAGIIEAARAREEPRPQTGDADLIRPLAVFVAQARSAVERNSYSREIEFAHAPEAPTRIGKALGQLLFGLDRLGVPRTISVPVVAKTALDSMQPVRLTVASYLLEHGSDIPTSEIATACDLESITCRRALEDLAAHHIVHRESQGQGKADLWTLDESEAADLTLCLQLRNGTSTETSAGGKSQTSTEMSEGVGNGSINPFPMLTDISVEVGPAPTVSSVTAYHGRDRHGLPTRSVRLNVPDHQFALPAPATTPLRDLDIQ